MKQIKDLLNSLKIPEIDDQYQFTALRSRLLHNFFSNQRQYLVRYRWALSLAALMFLILVVTIIIPHFAQDANNFVFGDQEKEIPAVVTNDQTGNGIVMQNDQETTIKSGNDLISNDKTYLIRQYNSPRVGKVMVVSEYNRQLQNNKIRKVTAGSY